MLYAPQRLRGLPLAYLVHYLPQYGSPVTAGARTGKRAPVPFLGYLCPSLTAESYELRGARVS